MSTHSTPPSARVVSPSPSRGDYWFEELIASENSRSKKRRQYSAVEDIKLERWVKETIRRAQMRGKSLRTSGDRLWKLAEAESAAASPHMYTYYY